MTGPVRTFNPEDLALPVDLYAAPAAGPQPRRPPWTWAALTPTEQEALARMIDVWVDSYNHVHAITPTELIPPCWRQHPALAAELAVQLWLWYLSHLDRKATPAIAGEYYLRHLPGFRTRVDRLLASPPANAAAATTHRTNRHTHDLLKAARFGFPQLGDDPR
jgi:hypothetical protein